MVKVGFVILTWNSEKYIDNCLNSIINCKNVYSVITIIDNGSNDKTTKILRKFEKNIYDNGKIKVFYLDKNFGTTVSRNMGLKYLKDKDVDYICILDSDTAINEDAIMTLTRTLKKNNNIGIIGPQMRNFAGQLQNSGRRFPTLSIKLMKAIPINKIQKKGELLEKYNFNDINKVYEVEYLISACWFMRTEIIDIVGLLDENIFYAPEDVDYCMRVWKNGYKCCFSPKANIIHDYQRISKKKLFSRMNYEHVKGLIYFFIKHRYLFNAYKIINKK